MKQIPQYLISLLLPLVLAAVSCEVRSADSELPVPDLSSPIIFGASGETKGFDPINTIEDLKRQHFGVYAGFSQKGTAFHESTRADNYLRNQEVLAKDGSDGIWAPSVTSYWPIMGSLSFFGYAPYTAKGDTTLVIPSEDYKGGILRGTYSPASTVTSQIDLGIARPQLDRVYSDGPVPMNFKHTLTRVFFYFRGIGEEYMYKFKITKMDIKGVVGTNNFTFALDDEMPCAWDSIGPDKPRDGIYHLTLSSDAPHLKDNYLNVAAAGEEKQYVYVNEPLNGRLYLLPQPLTERASVEVTLTVYSQSGSDWIPLTVLNPIEVKLPADVSWEAGKAVAYYVTIDIPELRTADIKAYVSDWIESGNNQPDYLIQY